MTSSGDPARKYCRLTRKGSKDFRLTFGSRDYSSRTRRSGAGHRLSPEPLCGARWSSGAGTVAGCRPPRSGQETVFFKALPAVNFGVFEAAIRIFSPV